MSDELKISDGGSVTGTSTISLATNSEHGSFFYSPPRAICPVHGEVDGGFTVAAELGEYKSPALCPKCYVDWHTQHITNVVPRSVIP